MLFGSATNGWGVRRLLKALRHEAPGPGRDRLPARGRGDRRFYAFKVSTAARSGGWRSARVLGGAIEEGSELRGADRQPVRLGTLFAVQGDKTAKLAKRRRRRRCRGRQGRRRQGRRNGCRAATCRRRSRSTLPPRNCALAIEPADRKDDVKLSGALERLVEEDPSLAIEQDEASHETAPQGRQRRASQHRAGADQAALRGRGGAPRAVDRLSRIDPPPGHPARPPQEAVGRPRPVRRRGHRGRAAAARRGLPLRRQDLRRRHSQAIYPGGRAGRARRDGQGAARLPGGRRRGDPDRRQLPQRRFSPNLRSAPPGGSRCTTRWRRPRRTCSSRCRS